MKLAPTITSPASSARPGWLARVLRAGAVAALFGMVASAPALAQRHDHEHVDQRAQPDPRAQQDPRAQPDPRGQDPRAMPQPPQRFDPRAFDSREFDSRQDPAMRQEARRGNRMTPDERRDLRRQINEAGMDLYPHPPRR